MKFPFRSRPLALAVALLTTSFPALAGVISGRVLDTDGKGVPGARIEWTAVRTIQQALLDDCRGVEPRAMGASRTESDGRFAVRFDKPVGDISIRFQISPGFEVELEGPFDSAIQEEPDDVVLPSRTATISGRVVDEGGRGVAGARVEGRLAWRGNGGEPIWTARTAADGTFRFSAVSTAPMLLTVRAAGFVASRADVSPREGTVRVVLRRGGVLIGSVVDETDGPVAGAIVAAGGSAAETDREGRFRLEWVRPGEVSLVAFAPGDRIGSRSPVVRAGEAVTLGSLRVSVGPCIAGLIVDESSRQPIAGAHVAAAVPWNGPDPDPLARRSTRSDERGKFRVCGLAAGPHRLDVDHRDYLARELAGVPARVDSTTGVSVALRRAAVVVGRVVDEKGGAVVGARVRLRVASAVAEGVTTSGGRFRLRRVAPARSANLEAEKIGFTPATVRGLNLKPGPPQNLPDLVLRRGLHGHGRIVDPGAAPIAGVEVRSAPEADKGKLDFRFGDPPPSPDAVTDAEGRFEVTGLEPGEYRLLLWREGFADKTVAALPVQRDSRNEWAPIILERGAPIAGRVLTAEGKAIADAHVHVFPENGRWRFAATDDQGRFRFEDLPPAIPVDVGASAEGFIPAMGRRVTPPAANVTLALSTGARLSGRVEDAATKEPVRAFTVALISTNAFGVEPPSPRDFRSEEGRFTFESVTPGRWSVRISASGYPSVIFPVGEVTADQARDELILDIRKGLSLSGRVLDGRGRGVANARAVASAPESDLGAFSFFDGPETATDADGRFLLEGLPTGTSTIEVSHSDFLTATRLVSPDTEPRVDVVLRAGSRVAGKLVAADGVTPVAGRFVRLDGEHGSGSDTTGHHGGFTFENRAAGNYSVSATGATSRAISLAEGQSIDDLVLEQTGGTIVRGTVAGLPPAHLSLLRVLAVAGDYRVAESTTDERGRFILRGVPAGSVRVQVSTRDRPVRVARRIVEVPEGVEEVAIDVVFEGSSRLSGRVTRSGEPAAGVSVVATAEPVGPASPRTVTITDDRGFFQLEGLADGDYRVALSGLGGTARHSLRVEGDSRADFELPAARVSGRVRDAGTGEPLSGAQVRLESGSGSFEARAVLTDVEGGFAFDDLEAGPYRLTANREGFLSAELPVVVRSVSTDLAIALKPSDSPR